ncbi:hypothetical protein BDA99DRAFT_547411 [Phascolomyces articulosus]|uniref:Mediator of RNA polymerase II transcription subunit 8 n=1 Tax=Phascolomyces articulosus TaxID=60185 RepID=A0AAD5PEU5_9FUNG|nr:hypothetical protein BDA99DRAFT_547411 [Phascolomyces articulosus]
MLCCNSIFKVIDNLHETKCLDPNTIQELEALRSKLWSLQETFQSQINYLKEPKYPFTWPDLLNKFNMLTAKFASLSDDFYGYIETGSNGTLPKLMLHPYIPTTTEHETNILSVLLRTKLIPDIEKLELETQAALAKELMASSSTSAGGIDHLHHHHQETSMDDEQLIRTRIEQWNTRRQRHDRIAGEAAQFVNMLVDDHRDTFLQRYSSEDEEEDEDEDMDGEQKEKEEKKEDNNKKDQEEKKPWEKLGFPSEDVWRRWKLECAVNYYSSGKEQLPGSDLKKLATGAK